MKGNKLDYMKRYKTLVEKVERGEIAVGDACHEMAGGMAMGILRKDAKLEKVMLEAGELEVAIKQKQGNRENRWAKLKDQIQQL